MTLRILARLACLTLALAALAAVPGCCNSCKDTKEAGCTDVKPGEITTVNKMCVIETEDPVNPDVTPIVWKGQKVGLCCDGCRPKWNKLTDAQKDDAVAKAIALSK